MGKPIEPDPAKLFMGLILPGEELLHLAMEELSLSIGKIDFVSEKLPFNFTDYYEKEMGAPLFRQFITFEDLISIPSLPAIKRNTNGLEKRHADSNGNRRINIDPGYLCLQHIILATTKGYVHRPYLRDGIYADLTLVFRDKSFRSLEWTYPDYRHPEIIRLFNRMRERYKEELRRRESDPW